MYVAAISSRPALLSHLRAITLGRWTITRHDSVEALCTEENVPTPGVVVFDMCTAEGGPNRGELTRLRARFPDVPTVGYGELTPPSMLALLSASEAGLEAVALKGEEEGLERAIARATAQRLARRILANVPGLPRPRTRAFMRYCLTNADMPHSVAQACSMTGVSLPALRREIRLEGLPSPAWIVQSARALVALHLLTEGGWDETTVAYTLRYPSRVALRRAIKRYHGGLGKGDPLMSSETFIQR
jgi:AraC-like DNA-binding protein